MPPVGFEHTISAGERPKTYALDRAATGTGKGKAVVFLLLFPRMLQSVRRHSAIVLTVTVNGMQQIYTVVLLTPWSRVLLEKLTGFEASQEIPHIYGTRKFITVLTSVQHLSLS
jgi:hypothetical protein